MNWTNEGRSSPENASDGMLGCPLDHIVYATPDTDAAVADLTERTGLRPVAGGAHTDWGTRNCLVGLEGGAYLEIVGPDPQQKEPDGGRPFRVDELHAAGVVTWCVRTTAIDDTVSGARASGYDPGAVREMSRRTAQGSLLQWRLTDPRDAGSAGLVPFLIDWGGTQHPTTVLEPQAEVSELSLSTPDPHPTSRMLAALGISRQPRQGPHGITVTLRMSTGQVVLTPAELR